MSAGSFYQVRKERRKGTLPAPKSGRNRTAGAEMVPYRYPGKPSSSHTEREDRCKSRTSGDVQGGPFTPILTRYDWMSRGYEAEAIC